MLALSTEYILTPNKLPLLHMLVSEYNQLLNSSVVPSNLPDIDDDAGCDLSSVGSTVSEYLDMEVDALETEMIVMLSMQTRKRKFEECTAIDRRQGVKRGKHNMSKMMFTNPQTMQRTKYTFEFSIWYMNYVNAPQNDDKKWCSKF